MCWLQPGPGSFLLALLCTLAQAHTWAHAARRTCASGYLAPRQSRRCALDGELNAFPIPRKGLCPVGIIWHLISFSVMCQSVTRRQALAACDQESVCGLPCAPEPQILGRGRPAVGLDWEALPEARATPGRQPRGHWLMGTKASLVTVQEPVHFRSEHHRASPHVFPCECLSETGVLLCFSRNGS